MRSTSERFNGAAFAQESGDVVVVLITIDHPSLDAPLRFSSDPTTRLSDDPLLYGTVSRGETFYFVPVKVALPDEQDRSPEAKLTLDNISRDTIALIRAAVSPPPTALLEVVLAATPDVVEASFADFTVSKATSDAQQVEIELTFDTLGAEPVPAMKFDPGRFPGLFNRI